MQTIKNLKVEIYRNNTLLRTVDLSPPEDIPASDQNITQNRPSVVYSQCAWSAKLDWAEVQPGLHLKFIDSENRTGELTENKIDFLCTR